MTYDDIKSNKEINTYIETADKYLEQMGYTEHSFNHVLRVTAVTEYILKKMNFDEHTIELGKIASYMHDIGNVINRDGHAKSGAIMAFRILDKLGMPYEDISNIISAIGNHDESSAYPVSVISAALIIADKTDVRRSRVRNKDISKFDIHSRVNYAATRSRVILDNEEKTITMDMTIDTKYCSIMEYFEIFLTRMMLCKKAANYLGLEFKLIINDSMLV